jgi:hypothetical protein
MARRPQTVYPPDGGTKSVTVTWTMPQALAIETVLRHGMNAIDAHELVRNTGLMREAIAKLKAELPAPRP